ncbi:MAG: TIGR03756 family integrating conjugative element protein [Gammaproteobacteria bacterium]|nr:TIGR03756 family integrating conjugative element protein [Gammaproteobacteria bacterium]
MGFKRLLAFTLACVVTTAPRAEVIDTGTILERTIAAHEQCLAWQWLGLCLWSKCDMLGCEVKTSAKVRHYRPDLLALVYRSLDDIPWREARSFIDHANPTTILPSSVALGGGHIASAATQTRNGDLRFFEASVFGHPLTDLPLSADKLFCQAQTRAAKPYYLSSLDAVAWRFWSLDAVQEASVEPGMREIGASQFQSWGAVYPRTGFVVQQSPPKAAAMVAQRACDIVVNPRRDHIAANLETPAPYTTVPNKLDERDPSTGLWQMISPLVDSACELFGSADAAWDAGRMDQSQAFIWNLWRPYECCEKLSDVYLGAVHF